MQGSELLCALSVVSFVMEQSKAFKHVISAILFYWPHYHHYVKTLSHLQNRST